MDDDAIQTSEMEEMGENDFLNGFNDADNVEIQEEQQEGSAQEQERRPADGGEEGAREDGQEPEEAPAGEETPPRQDGEEDPAQEAPKTWTLTQNGQPVSVSEADMTILAQRGLDFERDRQSYEESRPLIDLFRDFAQKSGMSLGDYITRIRAQAKQSEGMTEQEALRAVEMEDREARRKWRGGVRDAERRQADIREFADTFPDAAKDPQSIPQEVWNEVRQGRSLVAAYARYINAQNAAAAEARRIQAEALRKNQENAAHSAGSMRSAGAGPKDPFLEGWYE